MEKKKCILYDNRMCDNCGECNMCDLDPKKVCIACGKCSEIMRKPGGTPGCVIRDSEVYMPYYNKFVINK